MIDAARATIEVDEANLTFAEQEDKRYADLAATGYGSVQNAQQAASRIAGVARRDRSATPPRSSRRPQQVDVLKAELAQAEATLARDAGRCSGRPSSTSATPPSSRRSTASSATARCASANMCRPARS